MKNIHVKKRNRKEDDNMENKLEDTVCDMTEEKDIAMTDEGFAQEAAGKGAGFERSNERSERLIAYYKKLRKEDSKMSQKALETITGIPRQMIIRYEKGKIMPTVRAMNRLLEPLGYQLGIVPLEKDEDITD